MNNKKGLLLLEVMVSVAILAGALVFVTRVYSTAKNALQRSLVLFKSAILIESRMFEYEEKGKVESDFKDGKEFADDKGYSWSISTSPVPKDPVLGQQLDLSLVNLEVARLKDREERRKYVTSYSIATYLKDKKNE